MVTKKIIYRKLSFLCQIEILLLNMLKFHGFPGILVILFKIPGFHKYFWQPSQYNSDKKMLQRFFDCVLYRVAKCFGKFSSGFQNFFQAFKITCFRVYFQFKMKYRVKMVMLNCLSILKLLEMCFLIYKTKFKYRLLCQINFYWLKCII